MYLSADRLALANQTVRETFERSSVAWQAIPHWDIRDPGATSVRSDSVPPTAALPIISVPIPCQVTLAEAMAPTPDAFLAKVVAATTYLAFIVDIGVIQTVRAKAGFIQDYKVANDKQKLATLIKARAQVEAFGFRSPSAIFVDTESLIDLATLIGGYAGTDILLGPAMINSLHRVESLEALPLPAKPTRLILLGRRERIAHGCAAEASPGEEPVDLAISVMPSVVVIDDTQDNKVNLSVRIAGAVRVKDPHGVVAARVP